MLTCLPTSDPTAVVEAQRLWSSSGKLADVTNNVREAPTRAFSVNVLAVSDVLAWKLGQPPNVSLLAVWRRSVSVWTQRESELLLAGTDLAVRMQALLG